MLGIPQVACPSIARSHLTAVQAEIDIVADFDERVNYTNTCWSGRKNNVAFEAIKQALDAIRPGSFYCCYCETNTTCPIEHVRPKSLYPEYAFVWENYLPVCSRCNSEEKSDKWAIFDSSGIFQDLTPPKGRNLPPRIAPQTGTPVFLDLRQEDPFLLIVLDFADFRLRPVPGLITRDRERVNYTVETVLNLNDYDLCKARNTGYGNIRHEFDEYLKRRDRSNPTIETRAQQHFRDLQHPTVWKEMKRQSSHPAFAHLFQQAPEALQW